MSMKCNCFALCFFCMWKFLLKVMGLKYSSLGFLNFLMFPGNVTPNLHLPWYLFLENKDENNNNWFSHSIATHDARVNNALINQASKIYNLRSKAKNTKFKVSEKFKSTRAYNEIIIETNSNDYKDIISKMYTLQSTFPDFVSINQLKIIKRFYKRSTTQGTLPHGHGRYKTLYDYYKGQTFRYVVKLTCTLQDRTRPTCSLLADVQQ